MEDAMSTPTTPFLIGSRIYLRQFVEEDADLLFKWINDQEVTHFLSAHWPSSYEDEVEWIKKKLDSSKQDELVLGICLRETDELIGSMGLHHIDLRNGTAITGAVIGRKDLWCQGLGTDAKHQMLKYAFWELGLRKVCSEAMAHNGRSIGFNAKCGYREVGRRKRHQLKNGVYHDLILTEVFREEWEPLWENYQAEHF